MDETKKPGGTGSPWEEDSGSSQGLGATGVFGAVQSPEPESAWERELKAPPEWARSAPPEPVKVPEPVKPPVAAAALQEPVLHQVVLGPGGAESSSDLLDRMRAVTAERAKAEERSAAPAAAATGSGGFTELMRTLSNEPAPAASAPKAEPKAATPEPSGFTALLRTLETSESAPAPAPLPTAAPAIAPVPAAPSQPVFSSAPPPVPVQPAGPSSGGFTELLQTMPAAAPVSSGPAPSEAKPGSFTQLFGTFGGAGASLPAAPAESRPPASSSGAAPGSFTQMFSIEQQAPSAPPFEQERKPLPGRVDYGQTPVAGPVAPSPTKDPFAQPLPPAPSSAPPAGGVGITRLIQMLDEPAATPRYEPPPPAPPVSSTGGGVWTQTFSSLAGVPAPPVSQESRTFRAAGSSPAETNWGQPPASVPQVPQASGPSEFTRILDASKIREQSLQSRQATGAQGVIPAAPAQSVPTAPSPMPAPPQMQVPSYGYPQAPPMQGMGGMAQPPVYQPPQMPQPVYPSMAQGQSIPQAPSYAAPALQPHVPPPPPVPQAPPVTPAPAGGLQKYVPLLLVAIIVLLVVILVTVVFLLKH